MIIGTAVFAAVFLTGVRLALRIPVRDYYRVSKKTFVIPDIHGGFVAQGMCYDEDSSSIFLTGYQNDDQASPIYVKSKDSDSFKCVRMMMPNGEPSHNHAGGIAVNDDHVFVAGGFDHCLYVYSKNDILNAADGANIKCSGTFMAEASDDDYMQIAFTTIHDGMLYLGEFYREQNYQTLPSHKLTTSGGDYNQALVLAYPLDDSAEFGVSSKPEAAYSITDLIQGMCIGGDKIYLSASYGMADSHIYIYDRPVGPDGTIKVLGCDLPLYELDSARLDRTWTIAPMSEEIEIMDDDLYVLTESASNKYIFGKFTSAKYCYATPLDWGR